MRTIFGMIAALGVLSAAPAMATPVLGGSLQAQLDARGATINVNTDQYAPDQEWMVGALGGSLSRIVFELSAFSGANSFGIYDIYNPSNQLTIFSGSAGAGSFGFLFQSAATTFCVNFVSCADFGTERFGYFLNSGSGQTFYSQGALNADGVDHLVAYQGGAGAGSLNGRPWLPNEFLLGWEDLNGGGDRDYDDFVVLVESVIGISEPSGLALFGFGLLALSVAARARRKGNCKL